MTAYEHIYLKPKCHLDSIRPIYHKGGLGMRGVKTCPVNISHGVLWKNDDGSWQECEGCKTVKAYYDHVKGKRMALDSFEYVEKLVGRGVFTLGENDECHSNHTVFFHSISDALLAERKKKVNSEDSIPIWFLITNTLSPEQIVVMCDEYAIMPVQVPNVNEARLKLEGIVAKT